MYLKAINLKGFKSFPDRTRLTFAPGVSVIVGPNGCGKSNITDAVLWALGEQSPQAVRGSSMRDVIFAGGKGQSRRQFAEVEVVIDNSEGRAATDFSEISITRRIERDGNGEYRLNGARCRLADVMEVLSDTNMGREMHSVISQGKVEMIVNSKPRDRRMMIEEAAGLGKHRKRRHRAQLRLQRTRDNLDRALDVEREARSRLRPLKRQAEAAERTAKLVRQEDELRAELVAGELREQEDLLATADTTLIEIRGKREAVEGKLAEVRERRAAIEERVASGEDERRAAAQRLAEARAAVERLRARIEAIESAERELRSGLGERQLRLTALDDEPEQEAATTARIGELEAGLAALDDGGADAELSALREAAAEAERLRADAEAALPPLAEAAETGAAALQRATQGRDLARAEAEKAAQRRASLQGDLAAVEAKLARAAMEGGDEVLAGMVETGPGIERALSAALGEHLRATVVGSLSEGVEHLDEGEARAPRARWSHARARAPSRSPPSRARGGCSTWSGPMVAPERSPSGSSPTLGSSTRSPSCPTTSAGSRSRSTAMHLTARSASCGGSRAREPTRLWRRARSGRSWPRGSPSASRRSSARAATWSAPSRLWPRPSAGATRPSSHCATRAARSTRRPRKRAARPGSPSAAPSASSRAR